MSTVAKTPAAKVAAWRAVEALKAEVVALEEKLATARRRESADRSGLPNLIAQSDAREIAECRARIKAAAQEIAALTADLADTQEALKLAQRRDHTTANARLYAELQQLLVVSHEEVCDVEGAIVTLAEKLHRARLGLETVERRMGAAGVPVDPYWLRYKLVGIAQLCLHLHSDGALGERRTLDSVEELRRSGRASLKAAAREYETLALERLRSALGVVQVSEES